MTITETLSRNESPKVFRFIFYLCAFYFFLMGLSLIIIPGFIIKGLSDSEVSPAIIGMLRGAGGSIIPYSLLYILAANNPFDRKWALYIILFANILAVCLDTVSVLAGEYKISYALFDIPVETISILGIVMIRMKMKASV